MNTHISSVDPYHGPILPTLLWSFKVRFLKLVATDIWAR